jgi:hypothetical protein
MLMCATTYSDELIGGNSGRPNLATPTASSTALCERPVPTSPESVTASERVGIWLHDIDTTRTQSLPTSARSLSNSQISPTPVASHRCVGSTARPDVAIWPRTCS